MMDNNSGDNAEDILREFDRRPAWMWAKSARVVSKGSLVGKKIH